MNTELQKLIDSLEVQRIQLLKSLSHLPAEKLNKQVAKRWSVNQVLAHLITAERLSVAYLTKKIQAINEVDDTGLIEELKIIGLIISQRLPLKFKAPKVVVENTPKEQDIAQLEKEWINVRADLKQLLEKINDDQIKRGIYKHVRAGKLNIQHALIFFREHIIHHRPQINKLIS